MIRVYYFLSILFVLTTIGSCKKRPDPIVTINNAGTLTFEVKNMAGNESLLLNDKWYVNENKDSIQITTYNYFISNIVLQKNDGSTVIVKESYHLIKHSNNKINSFVIKDIPEGSYTGFSFLVGVDSARNVSGSQTGDLEPNSGMFWDWNTGYIMAKMEGKSPQASDGNFIYHLGGFSGETSAIRKITLAANFDVKKNHSTNIAIKSDAMQWFKTPHTISIKDIPIATLKNQDKIANNYTDMFSIDHID